MQYGFLMENWWILLMEALPKVDYIRNVDFVYGVLAHAQRLAAEVVENEVVTRRPLENSKCSACYAEHFSGCSLT